MKKIKVELTFMEPVLGSTPCSQDALRKFVAPKSNDGAKMEEEIESLEETEEGDSTVTVFPRTKKGEPFLWDYQVKGFFKSACQAMNMINPGKKLTAFKRKIDQLVFVDERRIPYMLPDGGEIENMTRPLRAQTAKGERIALASSEMLPEGTKVQFTITTLEDSLMDRVIEWLDYGRYNGLGQWRNAKYGSFTWEEIEEAA